MADTITVRLTGPLRRFVEQRTGENSLYDNVSEYIRDLVRKDYDLEAEERRKEQALMDELNYALSFDESECTPLDADDIIARAKAELRETESL
ncbi:MAG: ribbon-helix-helix domain-containing protein [Bdellovibrionales bacterium]